MAEDVLSGLGIDVADTTGRALEVGRGWKRPARYPISG